MLSFSCAANLYSVYEALAAHLFPKSSWFCRCDCLSACPSSSPKVSFCAPRQAPLEEKTEPQIFNSYFPRGACLGRISQAAKLDLVPGLASTRSLSGRLRGRKQEDSSRDIRWSALTLFRASRLQGEAELQITLATADRVFSLGYHQQWLTGSSPHPSLNSGLENPISVIWQ
ncbi:hypothetical protein RRG08_000661 [Elysia crispata]|uniref:Uncharacterized protein n=1 Tax=Elysia crispata TaxID=231223 RepID=A0AAE0Y8I6_9GAST|nr:hypothetical protein RRG08_000661 [Elysia crispata]